MSTATPLPTTPPDAMTASDPVPERRGLAAVPTTDFRAERSEKDEQRAERRRDPYYDRVADAGTLVVAATAGVASWAGLVLLGEHAGMGAVGPVRIAWLIALCIDVVALIALRAWINTRATAEYRRWGRGISIGALTVSIVGNALGHVLDDHGRGLLTATVAALPPLALFGAVHLRVLRTQSRREATERAHEREQRQQAQRRRRTTTRTPAADRTVDRAHVRPVPEPTRTDTATGTAGDMSARGPSGTADKVAALAAARPDMTTTDIATELGVTTRTVRRHLSALKHRTGNDTMEGTDQ